MKQRGQIFQTLLPWLVLIILILIVLIAYGIYSGWFNSAIEYFSQTTRFGR